METPKEKTDAIQESPLTAGEFQQLTLVKKFKVFHAAFGPGKYITCRNITGAIRRQAHQGVLKMSREMEYSIDQVTLETATMRLVIIDPNPREVKELMENLPAGVISDLYAEVDKQSTWWLTDKEKDDYNRIPETNGNRQLPEPTVDKNVDPKADEMAKKLGPGIQREELPPLAPSTTDSSTTATPS